FGLPPVLAVRCFPAVRLARFAAALVLLGAGVALGGDDAKTKAARDELEHQLSQLVNIPPPKVEIRFAPLDEPNFKLEAVSFELDGAPLPAPGAEQLNSPGDHVVFSGQLKPGAHTLVTHIVVSDASSVMFSYLSGYKWKVASKVEIPSQRGLDVKVTAEPTKVADAKDPKQRYR